MNDEIFTPSTTCTFCDNMVYAVRGKLDRTPVCSEICRKKLIYKPNQPERLNETEQCKHEWGSEEYENSPSAYYPCNKCKTVMR